MRSVSASGLGVVCSYAQMVHRLAWCAGRVEAMTGLLEQLVAESRASLSRASDTHIRSRIAQLQCGIAELADEVQEILLAAHFARKEQEAMQMKKNLKLVGVAILFLALMLAAPAFAQTDAAIGPVATPATIPAPAAPALPPAVAVAINPTTVQFTASADHNATLSDGTALLTRYELRFYASPNGTTPIATHDLGKPTPVSGVITVVNAAWFTALTANAENLAKVAAIGPGGEGLSGPSGPFVELGPPATAGAVVIKRP